MPTVSKLAEGLDERRPRDAMHGLLTVAFLIAFASGVAWASAVLDRSFANRTRSDRMHSDQSLKDSPLFGYRLDTK